MSEGGGCIMYYYHYATPIGTVELCTDGAVLKGLDFTEAHEPCEMKDRPPVIARTVEWLDIYFGGKEPGFTPPISLHTTSFRKTVYDILLTIPYGQTMTYGEIASILAEQQGVKRMSAQAVGSAVGHNPISIIIPCHRVVGADGSLTGYAGGLDKKTALLKLEKYEI